MFAGEDPSAASGVWHKRPRSLPHLRRPPQLGSDSLGSTDASQGRVGRAMPDERFRRRGYYGSYSRTATCARSRSLGATLTPACARRMQASRRSGAPVCLGLSNEGSVL